MHKTYLYRIYTVILVLLGIWGYHGVYGKTVINWPSDYNDTMYWGLHLTFIIGLSFAVPICCWGICGVCGIGSWIVRKYFMLEGSYRRSSIKKYAIPFFVLSFIYVLAGVVYLVFFISNLNNFMIVKRISFGAGTHVNSLPDRFEPIADSIYGEFDVPKVASEEQLERIKAILERVENVHETFSTIQDLTDSSQLDDIAAKFQQIVDEYPADAPAFDFSENEVLTQQMVNQINNLNGPYANGTRLIGNLRTELIHEIEHVGNAITDYDETYTKRYDGMLSGIKLLLNDLENFLNAFLQGDIANFDLFTTLVVVLLGIIGTGGILLSYACLGVAFISILKCFHKVLWWITCYTCIVSSLFFLTFAFTMLGFATSFTLCDEYKAMPQKMGSLRSMQSFIVGFQNASVEIEVDSFVSGIQNCGSNEDYLSIIGIENGQKLGSEGVLSNFSSAIHQAKVPLVIDNPKWALSDFQTYRNSIGMSDTPAEDSIQLESDIEAHIDNHLRDEYEYEYTETKNSIRDINAITEQFGVIVTLDNIFSLNVSRSPLVGNLTSDQAGTVVELAEIVEDSKQKKDGNPTINDIVTAMDQIHELFADIQDLFEGIENDLALFSGLPNEISNINDNVLENYEEAFELSEQSIQEAKDNINRRLDEASEIQCRTVGEFFSNSTLCDYLRWNFLITSILSVVMGLLSFALYILLLSLEYRILYLDEMPWDIKVIQPFEKLNSGDELEDQYRSDDESDDTYDSQL